MTLTWHDAEEIGILLLEQDPHADPLTIRFTDLHNRVIGLPGFEDDPQKSNESILEAIQMAWYDEYRNGR